MLKLASWLLYVLCLGFASIGVLAIVSAFSNTPSGHPSPSAIGIVVVLILPGYGLSAALFGIAGIWVRRRRRSGAFLALALVTLDSILSLLRLTGGHNTAAWIAVLLAWTAIDCAIFVLISLKWKDLNTSSRRVSQSQLKVGGGG